MNCAFVSLLTSDNYLPGALVLAYSLKQTCTKHELAIMVTDGVSETVKSILASVYGRVILVPLITSKQSDNLALLGRRELDVTFSKFSCFDPDFAAYDKIAFLDADTLVLGNIDDIFDYVGGDVVFAAAPDIGWPDCFNSGVFVTIPSKNLCKQVFDAIQEFGSFDGTTY
jgi:alpha-N-acetylglucosamine transferase